MDISIEMDRKALTEDGTAVAWAPRPANGGDLRGPQLYSITAHVLSPDHLSSLPACLSVWATGPPYILRLPSKKTEEVGWEEQLTQRRRQPKQNVAGHSVSVPRGSATDFVQSDPPIWTKYRRGLRRDLMILHLTSGSSAILSAKPSRGRTSD
ncbi:unnamed protein product [Nezara viridula]|uniref:Uncharacterized protein n=1 Tax=Nezara viridula TaxID=85310 RepID=A0A9P0GZC3_NEZVI|nr:unnamed protein product [Nezara viridula]